MDLGLTGRAYLVTGGSRGLGLATAQALVADGARVALLARPSDDLERTAQTLGALACPGDLTDPESVPAALDAMQSAFGGVHGALISVGGPPPGSVLTTGDDAWRAAFESVFLGCVRASREVVRAIRATGEGGALAWVLSTSAVEVFPGLSTSNGLRPGLAMLVTDLADEVGPEGIRVNGLLPGRIATERLARLDAASGDANAIRASASARIPLRRYGEPAEFGQVAAFLLSPAAAYVTGTLVAVDGGATRQP